MDRKIKLFFSLIFSFASIVVSAKDKVCSPDIFFLPYLQIAGINFSDANHYNTAVTTELFMPLWQRTQFELVFADVKYYHKFGTSWAENIQLGYRHLSLEKQYLLGIYGSFDYRKTSLGHDFNQVAIGVEFWLNHWFIGSNFYKPIGQTTKVDKLYLQQNNNTFVKKTYEEAAYGIDTEVGYEFTKVITAYLGAYYFKTNDIGTKYGPKVKLTCDWYPDSNRRILRIFDKIGLEAGVKKDISRGTTWYTALNVRVGYLLKERPILEGIALHMLDPIHRDTNIATLTRDPLELISTGNLTPQGTTTSPKSDPTPIPDPSPSSSSQESSSTPGSSSSSKPNSEQSSTSNPGSSSGMNSNSGSSSYSSTSESGSSVSGQTSSSTLGSSSSSSTGINSNSDSSGHGSASNSGSSASNQESSSTPGSSSSSKPNSEQSFTSNPGSSSGMNSNSGSSSYSSTSEPSSSASNQESSSTPGSSSSSKPNSEQSFTSNPGSSSGINSNSGSSTSNQESSSTSGSSSSSQTNSGSDSGTSSSSSSKNTEIIKNIQPPSYTQIIQIVNDRRWRNW